MIPFVLSACLGLQKPVLVTHFGVGEGPGSAGSHIVSEGDTLWTIAERYRLPLQDIAVYNKLQAPFRLAAGQRVKLPPPREYRVLPGDTVVSIGKLFGVSPTEIVRLNSLRQPYTLLVHQYVRLPVMTANLPQESSFAEARSRTFNDFTVSQSQEPPIMPAPVEREALAALPDQAPPPQKPMQTAQLQTPSEKPARPLAVKPGKVPARSSGKFLSPVEGKLISGYGPKAGGLHNDGINIAARRGTPVLAAENGVVVYAGNELKGSGNLILVRHEDRWMTAYAHMDKLKVARGDVVKRGQAIGTVGSSGSVDSPQLHFEVRRGTEALNPKVFMESRV
jgi:murein DD-endopeptidase MepM/ murein hydrolase activator NlpD